MKTVKPSKELKSLINDVVEITGGLIKKYGEDIEKDRHVNDLMKSILSISILLVSPEMCEEGRIALDFVINRHKEKIQAYIDSQD